MVVTNDSDLSDAELDALMSTKPSRNIGRKLTIVLSMVLLIGGGFWGGAWFQKEHGSSSSSNLPDFSALTGAGGGTGGTGGATTGDVKLVDGTNVYVTTTSGSVVKVVTTGDPTVTKKATSSVGDIKPGDSVTVQGQTNSDGTVTASSISIG